MNAAVAELHIAVKVREIMANLLPSQLQMDMMRTLAPHPEIRTAMMAFLSDLQEKGVPEDVQRYALARIVQIAELENELESLLGSYGVDCNDHQVSSFKIN